MNASRKPQQPQPEWHPPGWFPTFTLERQLAEARERMGPERWAQLQKEWDS